MRTLSVAALLFLLSGCGESHSDGRTLDLRGAEPAEGAEAILDALCDWGVECGGYEIECTAGAPPDGSAGTVACSATQKPMAYTECREEVDEEREDITRCLGLFNDEEVAKIDACITAMVNVPCRTQAELDAYAERVAAGDYDTEIVPTPAECEGTEELFDRCED
jgi:hypothetical protein